MQQVTKKVQQFRGRTYLVKIFFFFIRKWNIRYSLHCGPNSNTVKFCLPHSSSLFQRQKIALTTRVRALRRRWEKKQLARSQGIEIMWKCWGIWSTKGHWRRALQPQVNMLNRHGKPWTGRGPWLCPHGEFGIILPKPDASAPSSIASFGTRPNRTAARHCHSGRASASRQPSRAAPGLRTGLQHEPLGTRSSLFWREEAPYSDENHRILRRSTLFWGEAPYAEEKHLMLRRSTLCWGEVPYSEEKHLILRRSALFWGEAAPYSEKHLMLRRIALCWGEAAPYSEESHLYSEESHLILRRSSSLRSTRNLSPSPRPRPCGAVQDIALGGKPSRSEFVSEALPVCHSN